MPVKTHPHGLRSATRGTYWFDCKSDIIILAQRNTLPAEFKAFICFHLPNMDVLDKMCSQSKSAAETAMNHLKAQLRARHELKSTAGAEKERCYFENFQCILRWSVDILPA